MFRRILRYLLYLPVLGLAAVLATSCTQLGLNYASLEIDNKPAARPPLQIASAEMWESADAPALRDALEAHVFGPVPVGLETRTVSHTVIDPAYLGGQGSLEEYVIEIGSGSDAIRFHLATVFPNAADGPAPLIIGQTFSQNPGVFRQWDLYPASLSDTKPENGKGSGGMMMGVITFIFGSYIERAPVEDYLARGYAFANFYAAEIVPDRGAAGRAALARFPAAPDGRRPTGAVAAWAAGYFAAIDVLDADPRIDQNRTAIFGHSRHGKSALVAGAWDERIELVVSHQSGTGGASLSRQKPGETVKQITRSYPHWFDPTYAEYGGETDGLPIDQHMLIALLAPRRVLLGNGRRDVWSDPNGAFRAARGASAAWQAYGRAGLSQARMQDYDPSADIAYLIRPGGHGIIRKDVDAFLAFLDSSFMSSDEKSAAHIVASD